MIVSCKRPIVLLGGEVMGEVDKNGYKYFGVLEGEDIMQKESSRSI